MRYTKTVTIQSIQQLDSLQAGQWFKLGDYGNPGQYMGKTRAGVDVVRHGKFSKASAKRNNLQRAYAKSHGAK